MSEHSAQRKTIACPDKTRPRGVRVETYCGLHGAGEKACKRYSERTDSAEQVARDMLADFKEASSER